jgi:hypothetical protein
MQPSRLLRQPPTLYVRCQELFAGLQTAETGSHYWRDYVGTLHTGYGRNQRPVMFACMVEELGSASYFIVPGRNGMLFVLADPTVYGLESSVFGGTEQDVELFLRQFDA